PARGTPHGLRAGAVPGQGRQTDLCGARRDLRTARRRLVRRWPLPRSITGRGARAGARWGGVAGVTSTLLRARPPPLRGDPLRFEGGVSVLAIMPLVFPLPQEGRSVANA